MSDRLRRTRHILIPSQFNSFWFYITPWIGGIIADCWLGRYYTIMLFVFVYL